MVQNEKQETRGDANVCGGERKSVDFPSDIMYDILSRLPIEDLIRSRAVCKSWDNLTREPHFVDLQMKRALLHQSHSILLVQDEFNYIPESMFLIHQREDDWKGVEIPTKKPKVWGSSGYAIVGSCNGLVCLASKSITGMPVFVYNPITRECAELPIQSIDINSKIRFIYGFGFDPTNNKYKVIFLYQPVYSLTNYRLRSRTPDIEWTTGLIITVGEDSWRELELFTHRVKCKTKSQTLYIDGKFHWMIKKKYIRSSGSDLILSFDLTTERFHTTKFSDPVLSDDVSLFLVCPDSLAIVEPCWYGNVSLQIRGILVSESNGRLLKKEICEFLPEYHCKLLGRMCDESYIYKATKYLKVTKCWYPKIPDDHLALYIPEKKQSFLLDISGIPSNFNAFFFVPTLVSPSVRSIDSEEEKKKNQEK